MQEGASPIPSRSLCPGASGLFLADLSWCQRSSFQNSPWQGMKLGPQTVGWEGGRASGCFLCWEKLEEGGGRSLVPGVRWPRSRPLSSGQWDLLGAGGAPCVVPGTRGGGAGGWGPAWALPFLPFRGRETSPQRKGTWDPPFVLHLSLQPERESHHLKKSRQLISNESRNMPTSQAENGGWTPAPRHGHPSLRLHLRRPRIHADVLGGSGGSPSCHIPATREGGTQSGGI